MLSCVNRSAWRRLAMPMLVVMCLCALPARGVAASIGFPQTDLVSDVPGASLTDPNLKTPWGIAETATSPLWVTDQGAGVSTIYGYGANPDGPISIVPLVVTVPGGTGPAAGPTGIVFNSTSTAFKVNGTSALVIFGNLNGTISAWNGGPAATDVATTFGGGVTGLALGVVVGSPYLYAATPNGINVYDSNFLNVTATTFAGKFVDPNPIGGDVPVNIANLGGQLYVTYAPPAGIGGGFVDEYDTAGDFIQRIETNGPLDSPFGLALAPTGFGSFGGDLLIGNLGDGRINAFDPSTDAYLGFLVDPQGNPIVESGLHSIIFGNGGSGGDSNTLFTVSGDGVLSSLTPATTAAPEPASLILLGTGLIVAHRHLRRRNRPKE